MYLQSIHLIRLVSRLITVKSLQSEWRITALFSAECGSSLNSSRVPSAELNVYPYIIPVESSFFEYCKYQCTIMSKLDSSNIQARTRCCPAPPAQATRTPRPGRGWRDPPCSKSGTRRRPRWRSQGQEVTCR